MSDSSFGSAVGAVSSATAMQADRVISQASSLGQSASLSKTRENAKIEKSAKDFESILLSNWLQGAEQSFASVPGGDEDEDADADAGKEQFQGMAMQSLGSSMTASGGIGIAKMISKQLHKSEDASAAAPANVAAGTATTSLTSKGSSTGANNMSRASTNLAPAAGSGKN